jgi:hypothetical protein
MSKNIDQIFTANPITSNASTDLMYFGQSPYTAGDDAAMTYANFSAQFLLNAANSVTTTNITNGAVTYAKIQNITAGTLLGSISASPAAPGEVTIGTGLTLSSGVLAIETLPNLTLLGNDSGITGAPGPITIGAGLSLSGSALSATASGTVSTGTAGDLAYYAASGTAVGPLASTDNAVLVTSATGVASLAVPAQGLVVASSVLTVGGANNIPFNTNKGIQDNNGNMLLQFTVQPAAVNFWNLQNAATGNSVIFQTEGTDTNVNAIFAAKGTGNITFFCNGSSGNELVSFLGSTNPVNFFIFTASATTVSPVAGVSGTDANIIYTINGKGTGGVALEGTTAGDNAIAGYVGEFISSVIAAASATSLTTATAKNITSISLTAGDWDVEGNVDFPGITVGATNLSGWISLASATLPDSSLYASLNTGTPIFGSPSGFCVPKIRVSITSTTTVFLSARATFASGAATACGGIFARRIR